MPWLEKSFKAMFKDSKIVEFTCRRTKCSYAINFDIALYFHSLLQDAMNNVPFFVCSFDECHNNVIKKGQMGMLIRYWGISTNLVSTTYCNSKFLSIASANNLHTKFEIWQSLLDSNKMIQVYFNNSNSGDPINPTSFFYI